MRLYSVSFILCIAINYYNLIANQPETNELTSAFHGQSHLATRVRTIVMIHANKIHIRTQIFGPSMSGPISTVSRVAFCFCWFFVDNEIEQTWKFKQKALSRTKTICHHWFFFSLIRGVLHGRNNSAPRSQSWVVTVKWEMNVWNYVLPFQSLTPRSGVPKLSSWRSYIVFCFALSDPLSNHTPPQAFFVSDELFQFNGGTFFCFLLIALIFYCRFRKSWGRQVRSFRTSWCTRRVEFEEHKFARGRNHRYVRWFWSASDPQLIVAISNFSENIQSCSHSRTVLTSFYLRLEI